MTMRPALFIDRAWTVAGGDSYNALVTVDKMGIEIKGDTYEITDSVRLTFEEFAAIVEMVSRAKSSTGGQQQEAAP